MKINIKSPTYKILTKSNLNKKNVKKNLKFKKQNKKLHNYHKLIFTRLKSKEN